MVSAVIHVGSQQQVGYTVCIDGSQSYSQGTNNYHFPGQNDIFETNHYSWDFGDGTGIKSGEFLNTITHVYNAPGTYTIKLAVTDYKGRSASTSKSVTVGTLPKVTVSDNNRNAIISAISSLGGKPGIVYLPAGTYSISSTISIPSGVILEGAGMTKTQLKNTGTWYILSIGGNNVRIPGIEFKGPSPPNYHGIYCHGKKNLYVDHCDMHGFSFTNSINGYASATYEYNNIHDNPVAGFGYGIVTMSAAYTMMRHNEFARNRHSVAGGGFTGKFGNTGYDLIHNHVYGEHVDSALDMHRYGCGRVRIYDNVIENIGYHSGYVCSSSWGEIRRNTFRNCTGWAAVVFKDYGIPNGGAYNYHIDHNTYINTKQYRIWYGRDIYINCRKVDHLFPFWGNATWDDCVAAYGAIPGIVTHKDTGLGISGVKITANGHETTTE